MKRDVNLNIITSYMLHNGNLRQNTNIKVLNARTVSDSARIKRLTPTDFSVPIKEIKLYRLGNRL